MPGQTIFRKYRNSDRPAVRRLCCETGFLGNPIDPVFEDRELFADFLTAYYTDFEPESAFVVELDGEIKGYLLGSRQPLRQQVYNIGQNVRLFVRALFRYPGYNEASRRFIRWVLCNGWREVPAVPARTAHFHINLLPEARSLASTKMLIEAYLEHLRAHGEKRVYGQMVTFGNRRGTKMFERYGFRVFNKGEISKYKRVHPEPVFLCTVIKDLETETRLYAREPART